MYMYPFSCKGLNTFRFDANGCHLDQGTPFSILFWTSDYLERTGYMAPLCHIFTFILAITQILHSHTLHSCQWTMFLHKPLSTATEGKKECHDRVSFEFKTTAAWIRSHTKGLQKEWWSNTPTPSSLFWSCLLGCKSHRTTKEKRDLWWAYSGTLAAQLFFSGKLQENAIWVTHSHSTSIKQMYRLYRWPNTSLSFLFPLPLEGTVASIPLSLLPHALLYTYAGTGFRLFGKKMKAWFLWACFFSSHSLDYYYLARLGSLLHRTMQLVYC